MRQSGIRSTLLLRLAMNDFRSTCSEAEIAKIVKNPSPSNATRLGSARMGTADLEKRIAAYAAVGVAGTCLLSVSPDAEAKVVYTPAHVVIDQGMKFDLDVNHDGIVDFVFSNGGSTFIQFFGLIPQDHANAVVDEGFCISSNAQPRNAPAALPSGQEIGRQLNFRPYGQCMRSFVYYDTQGHWQHATNKYLGLAMRIDGQIHYGWGRLSTSGILNFQAVLTGYAYETEPGKSIVAGDEGGGAQDAESPDSVGKPVERGLSLGELAIGTARLNQ
jgi:hypothetical protein